ncbi:Hsp70 family protein [Paractinoplanes durhamensis]|uniref:Hsp70 family protein n=1 Tax=Paractinoplanes durhamensis TaxID=113563 RepID=UPI003625588D
MVLTEPEAAAAYYGASRSIGDGDTVAVYDLGGGTFDATVLRIRNGEVEVMGEPQGIERLGGTDFDEAILQWINHRHDGALAELDPFDPESVAAMTMLRQECVRAKEALSADTETGIPVVLFNQQFYAQLTRRDLESMIRAPIESTIGALVRAVYAAQVEVGELSAVLLVGGSSRIPLIGRMITEELGRPILTDANPKHAVALGAAAVAAAGVRPAMAGARVLVGGGSSEEAAAPPHVPSPRGVSRPAPPGWISEEKPSPSRARRRRTTAAVLAVLALLTLIGVLAFLLIGSAPQQPSPSLSPELRSPPAQGGSASPARRS